MYFRGKKEVLGFLMLLEERLTKVYSLEKEVCKGNRRDCREAGEDLSTT